MAAEQINKDKLNELLGIQDGQTFDDYMNEAIGETPSSHKQVDETEKLLADAKAKVEEIEGEFQKNIQTLDDAKHDIVQGGVPFMPSKDEQGSASARIDSMVNVESAFKSLEDLVDSTKQMIASVYSIISSCDVLDSETVSAAASLIGETRQLLAEYTGMWKQRIKFFDNVKMEMLKQQHRKEILELKDKLDREKWERQNSQPTQAEDVTGKDGSVPPGMVEAGAMDLLQILEEMDKDDDQEGQ